jgi:hypothetical protein
MFLCAANRILGYISLYMRPLFAFFGLLLCVSSILADEQRVIKDSEAIRYVGKYLEVYGLVVSVTTSPLGTAFINFGREYPNQIFAGFVPADSGITADQITKLQGENAGIVGTIELHKGKPEVDLSDRSLKFQIGGVMGPLF